MSHLEVFLESRRKGRRRRRHPRYATPYDAYSSVPGERMVMPYYPVTSFTGGGLGSPASLAAASAMCAAQVGGDGGAGGIGESVDDKTQPAGLTIVTNTVDDLAKDCPNSNVVAEIKRLFDRIKDDPSGITVPVYQGCDGMDAGPTSETISCLAAACEATLGAFRRATGQDYEEFRKRT